RTAEGGCLYVFGCMIRTEAEQADAHPGGNRRRPAESRVNLVPPASFGSQSSSYGLAVLFQEIPFHVFRSSSWASGPEAVPCLCPSTSGRRLVARMGCGKDALPCGRLSDRGGTQPARSQAHRPRQGEV